VCGVVESNGRAKGVYRRRRPLPWSCVLDGEVAVIYHNPGLHILFSRLARDDLRGWGVGEAICRKRRDSSQTSVNAGSYSTFVDIIFAH
jgi:hypothetical protein